MKKSYSLIFILATACVKHSPIDYNSQKNEFNPFDEEYKVRKRAEAYAYRQWGGEAMVGRDSFYFINLVEFLPPPDSIVYSRTVLDKKAQDAFRYIFEPVQERKEFWLSKRFHFIIDFENNHSITRLNFSYSLNASLFYFKLQNH